MLASVDFVSDARQALAPTVLVLLLVAGSVTAASVATAAGSRERFLDFLDSPGLGEIFLLHHKCTTRTAHTKVHPCSSKARKSLTDSTFVVPTSVDTT